MTTALPNGLVSHTDRASSELRRFDSVDTEDIAKLWRVYTTNTTTLKEDTGRRLENLFWRIWSNDHISAVIRGSTIAKLLLHVSEGVPVAADLTRETRSKSGRRGNGAEPDTNASAGQREFGNFSFGKRTLPLSSSGSPLSPGQECCISPRNTSLSQRRKQVVLPPPILKKPREISGQHRDGRALTPENSGYASSLQKGRFGDQYTPDTGNRSSSPGRKRTTFAKNLVSSIDDQTGLQGLMSETICGHCGAIGQAQFDIQSAIQSHKARAPHLQLHPNTSPRTLQAPIPSPSDPSRSPASSTNSSRTLANTSPTQQDAPNPPGPVLVDKDFRSKFVAKQRISGTNTTSMIPPFSTNSPTDFPAHHHTLTSTPPPPSLSTFQTPHRRTSSPGKSQSQTHTYRPGSGSPLESSSAFLHSTPLSRSSSIQIAARRPVQSRLTRLLELERDMERDGSVDADGDWQR